MKSHHTQSYKKNNLMIKSTAKNNYKKKFFSTRSNTQDKPHNNININNLSKNKIKKEKTTIKNKEEFPKKFNNTTNVTSSLNSDITNKSNSQNYKNKINQ